MSAPTDREMYEYVRRSYSPVLAVKVWAAMLNDSGMGRHLRRSFTHEMQTKPPLP